MSRVRSPNYPAFGLAEAINRIRSIFEKEQHLAAPKDVIARHLGYNGMNGGSIKAISALSKYGLLEEAANDTYRLSALAISILHPESDEEKTKAIREAAFKPALFGEMQAQWNGAVPSDANMKAYLIRRHFASDAVEKVMEAYKETITLVTPESGSYDPQVFTMDVPPVTPAQPSGDRKPSLVPPMSVNFAGDRIQVSATLVDIESVDKLIQALTATKALLPDRVN